MEHWAGPPLLLLLLQLLQLLLLLQHLLLLHADGVPQVLHVGVGDEIIAWTGQGLHAVRPRHGALQGHLCRQEPLMGVFLLPPIDFLEVVVVAVVVVVVAVVIVVVATAGDERQRRPVQVLSTQLQHVGLLGNDGLVAGAVGLEPQLHLPDLGGSLLVVQLFAAPVLLVLVQARRPDQAVEAGGELGSAPLRRVAVLLLLLLLGLLAAAGGATAVDVVDGQAVSLVAVALAHFRNGFVDGLVLGHDDGGHGSPVVDGTVSDCLAVEPDVVQLLVHIVQLTVDGVLCRRLQQAAAGRLARGGRRLVMAAVVGAGAGLALLSNLLSAF